jgi:hypothetical protein
MISFDKLIRAELHSLVSRSPTPVNALSAEGEWFPDLGSLITPADSLDTEKIFREVTKDENLNRHERRKLKRLMLNKKGMFRSGVENTVGLPDPSEILSLYPMRPADARVLTNYVLGKATRVEADRAFLESLRDPSFMSQWFVEHHDKLGAVGEWVRAPSKRLIGSMQGVVDQWKLQIAELSSEERKGALCLLSGGHWASLQEKHLLSLVNRMLLDVAPEAHPCTDIKLVETYCPGMVVCVRTMYASLRQSFTHNGRQMKESDFVDAVHAMYIPYVSMFRADRHMASIISPLAKAYGTQVFSTIQELVNTLQTVTASTS